MNDIISAEDGGTVPRMPLTIAVATISTIAGVTLLVGSEIWLMAAAVCWAVSGLLGLSTPATLITAALIAVPCLWATIAVLKLAIEAERDGGDQNGAEPT